jgi:hypothetical protein
MIDERIIELINAGMDGELGEPEKAELDSALAQSAEALEYQRGLAALTSLLDDQEPLELPDGLHGRMMGQIQLPAPKSRFRFADIPGFVRYGMAAAAGLLLTVGIYENQRGLPGSEDMSGDIGSMVGTIMRNDRAEVEETLDALIFDLDQVSSAVRLQRRDGALVLDVLLDARDPIDITVDFTSDRLQFDAIAQTQSELKSIEFADQAIRVQGHGRHHFAILLHRDSDHAVDSEASIKLRYTSDGTLIKEGALVTR